MAQPASGGVTNPTPHPPGPRRPPGAGRQPAAEHRPASRSPQIRAALQDQHPSREHPTSQDTQKERDKQQRAQGRGLAPPVEEQTKPPAATEADKPRGPEHKTR